MAADLWPACPCFARDTQMPAFIFVIVIIGHSFRLFTYVHN